MGPFLAVVLSPLHEALQQAVKNVAPVPHQLDILGRAVHALPVQNGPFKHVAELLPCALVGKTKVGREIDANKAFLHPRATAEYTPRKSGRTKSTMHQYSIRLFWRG